MIHSLRRIACLTVLLLSSAQAAEMPKEQELLSNEELYRLARTADLAGKAQTVLGPLAPDQLGHVLMHEHLFVDFFQEFAWPQRAASMPSAVFRRMQEAGWTIPATPAERQLFAQRRIDLAMINDLRRGGRSRANLIIDDESEVAAEIARYRRVGGRTVVDVTPYGLGRNPVRLKSFSQRYGLTVVAGTGWYRWPFQSASARELTIDALTQRMVLDIVQGDEPDRVRAGIIGEIGLDSRSLRLPGRGIAAVSNAEISARLGEVERRLQSMAVADRDGLPLAQIYDPLEIKVLRAAARASRLTGVSLTLHAREPWLGYLGVLQEEGVSPARVIIGHAHSHFMERELLVRALRKGVVLEADYMLQQYATRAPLGPLNRILDGVAWAIRNGYRDQVLLSLDLCNKLGQQRYGGGGYTTLEDYVFPYLRENGVTDEDLRHIMVDNPRRLLTIDAPQRVQSRTGATPGSPESP